MKKVSLLFSILCALVVSYSYAQEEAPENGSNQPYETPFAAGGDAGAGDDGSYAAGGDGSAADDGCRPAEHATGECYCLYCRYQPCYYNKWNCCYVPKYNYKKCCRYVPQYYQKQCCRYVPQYYCKTCCRQVPQYYYTCSCCYVPKYNCQKCCRYVPQYYWKHTCQPECCPSEGGAAAPCCGQ